MSDTTELVVDGIDSYLGKPEIFYIHPERIAGLKFVKNNSFESCTIRNSPVDYLTSGSMLTILEKIKPGSKVEVYIDQPLTVMQEYDANQLEANAKLAGFENFTTEQTTLEKEETKAETLLVSFNKKGAPVEKNESEPKSNTKKVDKKPPAKGAKEEKASPTKGKPPRGKK